LIPTNHCREERITKRTANAMSVRRQKVIAIITSAFGAKRAKIDGTLGEVSGLGRLGWTRDAFG
jgi:hypothetical protein